MALQLALQLGAGAVAQLSSSDLAAFYTSAASLAGTSAGCTADDFAADVLPAADAFGYAGNPVVPVLFQFGSDATNTESAIGGNASNLQTFSNLVLQGLVTAADIDTTFDSDFKVATGLASADAVPAGVKLAASVHHLQSRAVNLTVVDGSVSFIAELASGAAIPDLGAVVGHASTIPTCFGISNASLADLTTAASLATPVNTTSRAHYSIPTTAFDFEAGDSDNIVSDSMVYIMALLANEPDVLFVEPTVQPTTRACAVDAALSFPQGDAKEVAQGFGITGGCQYLHDRGIDGRGEVVAIIDDGLFVDSTFFYATDEQVFCADAEDTDCCPENGNAADLEANCVPDGSNTAVGTDLSADAQAALNMTMVISSEGTRKIASYVPFADGKEAAHGTAVASVVVGSPFQSLNNQCPDVFADAADIFGVASGARAVFVDIGTSDVVTNTVDVQIPYAGFQTMLQSLAYDNSGANAVTLAWGADTGGAADAVTRDIDSFVAENADAIVVAAAGLKDGVNGNTALAKNGISVGVYSQATSASLLPTFSVQLSNPIDAASVDNNAVNFCGYEDFTGSSAAAAVVAGQTALIEQYLKTASAGTVYHYDAAGAESVAVDPDENVYTGATVKALLVASANANCFGGVGSGNGFGVPVLDRVLPFEEEHQFDLRVEEHVLTTAGSRTREIEVTDTSRPLVISLAYTDVAPTPFAAAGHGVVNNVRVSVRSPSTEGAPNGVVLNAVTADGVEVDDAAAASNAQRLVVENPVAGIYTITVEAVFLTEATVEQSVSLVITGRFAIAAVEGSLTGLEPGEITSTPACCPWGTVLPTTSCFPISFIVLIVLGVMIVGLGLICFFAAKCKVKDVEH